MEPPGTTPLREIGEMSSALNGDNSVLSASVRDTPDPAERVAASPEAPAREVTGQENIPWIDLPAAELSDGTPSSSVSSSRRSVSSASSSTAARLRPPRASLGASSRVSRATMGILQLSDLEAWTDWTDTSLSSYEGVGQQASPVDVPALEGQIAQLEYSLRTLQDERLEQQQQIQQQEDANLQLTAALAKLTEENTTLTTEVARIASLRAECDGLQQALDQELAERAASAERAAHADRLIAAQQTEMDQLSSKLDSAESDSRAAEDRQRHLQRALEEAHREAALLRSEVQDQEERHKAEQRTIDALHATVREMRDASLALQEEKSRYTSELSSVRRQLCVLRRTPRTPRTASAAAASAASVTPITTAHSDSIHDEIISTIEKTGDGDPILPLSGIATPELVRAIHASPLNLHCSRLSQWRRMSTPSTEPADISSDVSLEAPEREGRLQSFSSATSNSYGSPMPSMSRPERVDQGTDCPPPRATVDRATEMDAPPLDEATGTELELRCNTETPSEAEASVCAVAESCAVQLDCVELQQLGTERHSALELGTESGSLREHGSESDTAPCTPPEETASSPEVVSIPPGETEFGEESAADPKLMRWLVELPAGGVEDEAGEVTESEAEHSTRLMWLLSRLAEGLCSEPTCSDTLGPEQNNNTTKREWTPPGSEPTAEQPPSDSRTLLQPLPDGLTAESGDAAALLYLIMAQLRPQEGTAASRGDFSHLLQRLQLKRTTSEGVLGSQQKPRFCSMPTVEEDPDTELPQHAPLRASFSLPCEQSDADVFPSLTDHLLADLNSFADENANNPNEKDLESKFCSLALAFKTDRLTLHERLDVQRRHRDQAEHNLEIEAQRFRDQLVHLNAPEVDRSEQQKTLQRQLDIVKHISQRLSRKAEMLGAAQQELRVSRAVEVMTQHVEALRHLYEREHAELEEARRVLATNNIPLHEPAKASPSGRRRASIAVFSRSGSVCSSTSVQSSGSLTPGTPPSPCLATGSAPTLRRRRNSLGAGDADGFGAITEEKEEDGEGSEASLGATGGATSSPAQGQLQLLPEELDPEELRSEVEDGVTDELNALRNDQELLANDIKTLLSRQRAAVLNQTISLSKMFWEVMNAWPYSRDQTLVRARYCCGGMFLLLAFMMLFLPSAYSSCQTTSRAWYSWAELLAPLLSVQHTRPPPL